MTTGLILATMWRRWYVMLLGLLLTAGALVVVHDKPPVYWTQVDVVFYAPQSARYPNAIAQTSNSVIVMAGLVGAELNKGVRVPLTSSAGTTLAGQGVRDGYMIRQPNSGGQWAVNFDRAVLDVQVIGPGAGQVRRRLDTIVGRIQTKLSSMQAESGASRRDFITARPAPAVPQIFKLDGNPARALVVTGLLGLAASVLAAVAFDGIARRRRARGHLAVASAPETVGPDPRDASGGAPAREEALVR